MWKEKGEEGMFSFFRTPDIFMCVWRTRQRFLDGEMNGKKEFGDGRIEG
jgi:hypothetical protein